MPVASDAEFKTLYPRIVRSKGYREAYLRGDRDVPYGRVLQVLGMMKQIDIVEVELVEVIAGHAAKIQPLTRKACSQEPRRQPSYR